MSAWNYSAESTRFQNAALDAERRLREIQARIKSRPSYKVEHDQVLARFFVFNHLHGRNFAPTRAALIDYLRKFLTDGPTVPSEVLDPEIYQHSWKSEIMALIKRLEDEGDAA